MVHAGRERKRAVAGSDQQTKQTESEESQSSVTVECGEQSQFEPEEDCGGERQVGESVKVRVTMDSGTTGHVMPDTMFPHVKLERKTSPKKFVAANGEQIKDLGEKSIPFKTNEGVQRCVTFRSANVVKPSISMQKVVRDTIALDEKNPHIRNARDGTVIKLHVNSGVCTMDVWVCLDEIGPVCFQEGEDAMTDEEGDGLTQKEKQEQQTGECVKAQETSQLQERKKNMKQHACRSATGAHTA